jgi:hypothetical protein
VDEAKKLSGPFGWISAQRNGSLLVSDSTDNIANIKKRLDELTAKKPEKK